jgi:hypothetical protein
MDSKGKNSGLPAFGARQTTVFAMCFLVTLLAYVDRVGFSVAFTKLSAAAGQDQTAKGAILSSFYYGYATSQIPCAWFASRFALHLRPLHPCPEPAALVLLTTSTCPTALPSSPLTLTLLQVRWSAHAGGVHGVIHAGGVSHAQRRHAVRAPVLLPGGRGCSPGTLLRALPAAPRTAHRHTTPAHRTPPSSPLQPPEPASR